MMPLEAVEDNSAETPYHFDANGQPMLHPMTPLGIPNNPPALPELPAFIQPSRPGTSSVQSTAVAPTAGPVAAAPPVASAAPKVASAAPPLAPLPVLAAGTPLPAEPPPASTENNSSEEKVEKKDSWTPIAAYEARVGRRDFFHSAEGKAMGFHQAPKPDRADEEENFPIGLELRLNVEEIHFGNPRIRVMNSDPAPMKQMLDWPLDKFSGFKLDVARISFGSGYRVWCAVGNRSNRLAYAMKRTNVQLATSVVVEAPPPPEEEDVDLTYGASIQGIQLVP